MTTLLSSAISEYLGFQIRGAGGLERNIIGNILKMILVWNMGCWELHKFLSFVVEWE